MSVGFRRSWFPSEIDPFPRLCELTSHTLVVTVVSWSSSGRYLASGSDDTLILLWERRGSGAWLRKKHCLKHCLKPTGNRERTDRGPNRAADSGELWVVFLEILSRALCESPFLSPRETRFDEADLGKSLSEIESDPTRTRL